MNPTLKSLHLERLTSPEIGAAIAAGMTTALFACGAVEQHGPRLPLFTDAEHGTRLAEEVGRLDADLMALVALWREVVEAETRLGARVGGHADIAESSIMLALHPSLVRAELAAEGFRAELGEAAIRRIIRDGLHTVTPNGIIGDARGLEARVGERCIAAAADRLAGLFG